MVCETKFENYASELHNFFYNSQIWFSNGILNKKKLGWGPDSKKSLTPFLKDSVSMKNNISQALQLIFRYCQAQPKPQLSQAGLSWLYFCNPQPPTHPHPPPSNHPPTGKVYFPAPATLVKHNRAKYTPTAFLYIPQHLIQLTNEALH